MAYDEGLLERCMDALRALRISGVRTKNVFGMRGLMQGSKMFSAVGEESIIVKLTEAEYSSRSAQPGVRPFMAGGSKLGKWVEIDSEAIADDPELREWLATGLRAIR
jgi:TfoX/Sxy family transcriptional regulator of competence genes